MSEFENDNCNNRRFNRIAKDRPATIAESGAIGPIRQLVLTVPEYASLHGRPYIEQLGDGGARSSELPPQGIARSARLRERRRVPRLDFPTSH